MPGLSGEQLAAVQAQIDADPQIQAILRDTRIDPRAKEQQLKTRFGDRIPPGYYVNLRDGQLKAITEGDAWRNTLLAGGLMAGGLGALGAFGGAAGAGAVGGAGAGSMPAVGVAPFSGLPGGIAASAGGAGIAGGAGAATGAAGAGSSILDTLLKVAPVGAGLVGKYAGGGFGGGDDNQAGQMSPELQEMLAMSMKRMTDQEPLFQAVSRQALAGLPTYAKQGN